MLLNTLRYVRVRYVISVLYVMFRYDVLSCVSSCHVILYMPLYKFLRNLKVLLIEAPLIGRPVGHGLLVTHGHMHPVRHLLTALDAV